MKTRSFALIPLLVAALLAATPASAQTTDWRRVQALTPGSPVIVSRQNMGGTSDRIFVFADADTLVALNLTGTSLDKDEMASLVEAASRFARPAPGMPIATVTVRSARVAPDGVWIRDRRIGDEAQRIDRIPRTAIVEIRAPGRRVGSKVGAIAGVAGGVVLGVGTAIGIATENQCGSSCSDEKALAAVSIVGLPIGAGLLGYHAFGRRTSEVVYRR